MAALPAGVRVVRQELRPGFLDVTLAVAAQELRDSTAEMARDTSFPGDQRPVRILCSAHSHVRHGRSAQPSAGPTLETTDPAEAVAFFLRHFRDYRNCCIAVVDAPEDTRCQSSVVGPRKCGCADCRELVAREEGTVG